MEGGGGGGGGGVTQMMISGKNESRSNNIFVISRSCNLA